jgi:hypothetical protein
MKTVFYVYIMTCIQWICRVPNHLCRGLNHLCRGQNHLCRGLNHLCRGLDHFGGVHRRNICSVFMSKPDMFLLFLVKLL